LGEAIQRPYVPLLTADQQQRCDAKAMSVMDGKQRRAGAEFAPYGSCGEWNAWVAPAVAYLDIDNSVAVKNLTATCISFTLVLLFVLWESITDQNNK